MEAIKLKKSKITNLSHRTSTGEGNRQAQRQRNVMILAVDTSSCSSGTADVDLARFESGQRSAKQRFGSPMKKLLEEEMKINADPKKHSPSVIARLMGLDGLPPQQHAYKQRKGTAWNFQHSISREVKDTRRDMYFGHQSHGKSSKGEQEFKDVYEVLEMSKSKRSCCPSLSLNSEISEAEMAFIEQKFVDAKRLSTNEKLLGSRELDDTLEVLDSNKDLLVKYLQQPDALFTKHVHDLYADQSHCSVAAKNSSYTTTHDSGGQCFNFEKEASRKNHRRSPRNSHTVPLTKSVSHSTACISCKSPQMSSDGKVESAVLPTRIVVLKPNLWKTQDATETLSPPCPSDEFPTEVKKRNELRYCRSQGRESLGKKQLSDDVRLSALRSRDSRVIAKEITKKMRNSLGTGSNNFLSPEFGAFDGEVSSYNISGNESEVTSASSRNSFVQSQYKPSRSCSPESSVSREAKKRLSERWKIIHKSQELGVVNRGSTLGEMLAIPDREERSNVINNGEECSGKLSSNDGLAGWLEPLGISSRDGWKDRSRIRNLPRSQSLPASSTAFASPKNSKHRENIRSDRYLMPKDAMKREKNKVVKGYLDSPDVLFPPKLRPSKKKYHSSHRKSLTSIPMSAEINSDQDQQKINLEENGPYENISIISETSSVTEDMVHVGHITFSFETPEIMVDLECQRTVSSEHDNAKFSSPMLVKGDSSIHILDRSTVQEPSDGPSKEGFVNLHNPVAEQESSASSKEADQPSPLSVLDALFTDDISSGSECFEGLSADLHGLQMQIQLLKSESDEYVDASMHVSSDEDVKEGSVRISLQKKLSEGSWVSSYLNDVLTEFGFDNVSLEIFTSSCYSLECPISPMVYEKLEKKYSDCTSLLMSERMLLFDFTNSGLLEVYHQLMDPHPWVRSSRTRIGFNCSKDEFINGMLMSLNNQKKINTESVDMMLAKEPLWLDLGDDTDAVGKYIEKLLMDELVLEVVTI